MGSAPSVLIVAGEASADLHGARVMAALRERRPDLEIFGIGGCAMREQGLDAIATAENISVAGLTEVIFALPRIFRIMRRLTAAAAQRRPSVAILLDLPDFNLRVAKRMKKLGIPVVYYISPQVWAWRPSRVKAIKDLVSQMLVVLPFEQAFYQERGVRSRFVGHPLVEELPQTTNRAATRLELGMDPSQGPIVALLPGSRQQEVNRHLALMLAAVQRLKRSFPDVHAIIPVASTIPRQLIDTIVRKFSVSATVLEGKATEALVAADVAVVCSGTATLQAALLARPMVVVYRVSFLTYHILKRLVKVAQIALVNLIAGHVLVPELIQSAFTAANVEAELTKLLGDPVARVRLTQDFAQVKRLLGGPGAANRVADVVLGYIADLQQNPGEPPIGERRSPTGQLWG
jgi:lipid-A-disaccharide synthase